MGIIFYQHNEHRMFFPKLIFFFLARLTKWNVRIEVFFNWILLQCAILMLYQILKENVKRQYRWLLVLSLCFFLAPNYYENLLWGFQGCIQLTLLAVIGAILALARVRNSLLRLNLAVLSCIIASFSQANGLAAWFVMLPLLIVERKGAINDNRPLVFRRKVMTLIYWLFMTSLTFTAYFRNFQVQMGHHPSLAFPWNYPAKFFSYFFTFLGAAFLKVPNELFTANYYLYGFIGVFLCFIFFQSILFDLFQFKKNVSKFCLLLFVISTGLMISFGRANFGLEQALSSRYLEWSKLFPLSLFAMLIAGEPDKKLFRKITIIFLLMAILVGIPAGWHNGITKGRAWREQQKKNAEVLASFEIVSDDQMAKLHPNPLRTRESSDIKRIGL